MHTGITQCWALTGARGGAEVGLELLVLVRSFHALNRRSTLPATFAVTCCAFAILGVSLQEATSTTTSVVVELGFLAVVFEARAGDVFTPAGMACNP